jgi:hypothetical protein
VTATTAKRERCIAEAFVPKRPTLTDDAEDQLAASRALSWKVLAPPLKGQLKLRLIA